MSDTHVKYLLVGGGVACSAAAQAIRARDREGLIQLMAQEVNRPYRRPLLSRDYLLGTSSRADLFTLSDSWWTENHVELHTGLRATGLDATRRRVHFDNGQIMAFDKLLIATGATPRPLKIPGAELPNVYYMRNIADADRLHNAIEKSKREGRPHARGRGRAVIVGTGLLAVELASTFTALGLGVDLLMGSAYAWPRFAGESAGRLAVRHLESHGVNVHPSTVALRLEGDGRVQRVALSNGETIDCDLVVPAIGSLPNKDLLHNSAIKAEKAILIDPFGRTSEPDIYAAGDCAAIFDPASGKYRRLEHWESAIATGTLAGNNMAGANEPYAGLTHFTSEAMGLKLAVWGEARHIERRIVRGSANVEQPDLIEFGIRADGRLVQAVAIGASVNDPALPKLVEARPDVLAIQSALQDPAVGLEGLL